MTKIARRTVLLAGAMGVVTSKAFEAGPINTSIAREVASRRGFNLSNFYKIGEERSFNSDDLKFMSDHGFKIIRLPFDYRVLFNSLSPTVPEYRFFKFLDFIIERAEALGIHVCLAMHRAPGYCVNPPYESRYLWRDKGAFVEFLRAWEYISERYRDIQASVLSFNIINEPKREIAEIDYYRVTKAAIETIRGYRSERLVFIDGQSWSTEEVSSAFGIENCIQSSRGYYPMQLTHHLASWVNPRYRVASPTWPISIDGTNIDVVEIERMTRQKWSNAISRGVSVSIGEWGVFNKTPHKHTIAYMSDCLNIWQSLGWGWMLWNFRGPFGVIDSGRSDVVYSSIGGYKVDEEMLALLIKNN